jgi:hypothetical protein
MTTGDIEVDFSGAEANYVLFLIQYFSEIFIDIFVSAYHSLFDKGN